MTVLLRHQPLFVRFVALVSVTIVAGCTGVLQQPPAVPTPVISGHEGALSANAAEDEIESQGTDSGSRELLNRYANQIGELSKEPLFADNKVDLLIDGPATYRRMLEAIQSAQHHVHLETYIFADDEVGERFARALIERRRQNVAVRMIYDSVGSLLTDNAFFKRLQEAGVEVVEFRNVNPFDGGDLTKINNRNHRKLLVVDNRIAFAGGVNFSRTYSSGSASVKRDPVKQGWRDTHIAVTGPAAMGFQRQFLDMWKAQTGDEPLIVDVETAQLKEGDHLVGILNATGGDEHESSIYRAYLEAMKLARHRIWITQAYFAPDDEFKSVLKDAAARGVEVRIIVPGVSDSNLVLYASRSHYAELIEAGIELYELSSALLHAKTAVIDGIWSTVGSSNLDYRSFLHNDEINAVILGADFGHALEDQFKEDIARTRRITQETWQKRSLLERAREKFAATFEHWL